MGLKLLKQNGKMKVQELAQHELEPGKASKLALQGWAVISSTEGVSIPRPGKAAEALTLVPPGPDWQPNQQDLVNKHIDAINLFRHQHGVQQLVPFSSLVGSATWKSMHMATYDYMQHDDPPPPIQRTIWERFADNGYTGAGAENICYGTGMTPQQALDILISAGPGEGHYDNLVNPAYNCVGVGVATDKFGATFYTEDFGILPASGPRPLITSFSPGHGVVGTPVTITGQSFDRLQQVVFTNNVKGTPALANASQIVVPVPFGAVTGPIIVATAGGYAVSRDFTVDGDGPTPPPPGGTVFEEWKKNVWPLFTISSQWHNFVGNPKNSADVALINKMLENPKASGTAHAAFAKAIVAMIRLAASH